MRSTALCRAAAERVRGAADRRVARPAGRGGGAHDDGAALLDDGVAADERHRGPRGVADGAGDSPHGDRPAAFGGGRGRVAIVAGGGPVGPAHPARRLRVRRRHRLPVAGRVADAAAARPGDCRSRRARGRRRAHRQPRLAGGRHAAVVRSARHRQRGPGAYYAAFSAQAGEDWAGVDLLATDFSARRLAFALYDTFIRHWAGAGWFIVACSPRSAPPSCSGAAAARCWRSSSRSCRTRSSTCSSRKR